MDIADAATIIAVDALTYRYPQIRADRIDHHQPDLPEIVLALKPIEIDCQIECAFNAVIPFDGLHDLNAGAVSPSGDKAGYDRVSCIILR